ncbi:MAG TPA: TIM barrel protein [Terriglobia bacterium]|nr:TIM barrel protein [Terriglobia bacterium]
MKTISRRSFLEKAAMGMAAAGYLAEHSPDLHADPLGLPIGVQTWEVREAIGKDFDGTLRQLAADGFKAIEMCSPAGYKNYGFGPLADMKASEMRRRIQSAGLTCQSCHFGFKELKDSLDERLAFAKDLGLKQMIVATFGLPGGAQLKDWFIAVDELNKLGARAHKAGIQLGFHNHDFEFAKLDGHLIYDEIMGKFDPKVIKMQFQVAEARLGYQAADYFEKYPGRFISMHLSDWSAIDPDAKEVPLGKGIVDWKRLFAAAPKAGIKNYFVEMEPDVMKASFPFLHKLRT